MGLPGRMKFELCPPRDHILGGEVKKKAQNNSKRKMPPRLKKNRGDVLELFQRRENERGFEEWTKVHG